MPDPIIERAARAACIEAGIAPDAEYRGGHTGFDWNWQSFVPEVRAVLQAIREPSEEMIAAAPEIDSIKSGAEAMAFWESMIDAALAE